MVDPLAARYDATPYRHGAIADSHPARIGAIARLHGMKAASPHGCRVLELGCGEGMNLLPLAERFPGAEFTGVDFSRLAIEEADKTRAAAGLSNVRFVCADLRTFEAAKGEYDYVTAHGVYSWVPTEVCDRLLAVVTSALAPQGVGYVSYNTLPGWGLPGGVRAILQQEVAEITDPQGQMEHARRVLTAVGGALQGQGGGYAAHLRSTVEDMLRKPPELFFHDDLAPVNEPCTFTHFAAHAERHGLHYLAEAHYATMHYAHAPAPVRAALEELRLDFRRQQQFLDVVFQRWLRNSLLVHAEPRRTPDLEVMRQCAFGSRLRIEAKKADLRAGLPLTMHGPGEVELVFSESAEKAALIALAQAGSARVPFAEAVSAAKRLLGQGGLSGEAEDTAMAAFFYRLFAIDALDAVLIGDGAWLQPGTAPSALMRYEAERGFTITNRWHEPVGVTLEGREWLVSSPGGENPAARFAGFLV